MICTFFVLATKCIHIKCDIRSYLQYKMNSNQQAQDQGIDIEQLEEDLGIFEVRLDEKLKELNKNFENKEYKLDVNKSYYDHFSNSDAQFKEIMNDLTQFLIKDQLASTPTLRSTFYKVLDSPLFCLFKSSKFELFELCLNGFDIQYQPDEAIKEVHKSLLKNTENIKTLLAKGFSPNRQELQQKIFSSQEALLFYSNLKSIQFKIFTLYSYIRKGAQFLKKEYQHRLYISQMFASIEKQLIPVLVSLQMIEPLKELTTLNFEIYNIQPTYDYFFFFFSIPPKKQFLEVFQTITQMAEKCNKSNNYNPFVIFVLKHHIEINSFVASNHVQEEYIPFIVSLITGAIRLLRAQVGLYEEFVSVVESLLNLSRTHFQILEKFLTLKPENQKQQLVAIRQNFKEEILSKNPSFLYTLRPLTFQQVKQRLEKAQQKYLFALNFADVEKNKLQNMLNLIGGVPQRFFEYVQGDFKAWNSTASITGKHKYIESQFNKAEDVRVPLQNIRMINNFLYLSSTYPKEYEALYQSKLNVNFFLDLLSYFTKNSSFNKSLGIQLQYFTLNTLSLFSVIKNQKDTLKIQQKIKYLQVFSKASCLINTPNNQTKYVSDLIKQIQLLKYELTTKQYINLLITIAATLPNTKQQCFRTILSSFSDLDSINQKLRSNRFHEEDLQSLLQEKITKEQSKLLKQKYSIVNNKLIANDLSLFKFTGQDISTNPLNFESRIDDVFISLTSNSKKLIQILLTEIVEEIREVQISQKNTSIKLQFLLGIVKYLCKQYPIVVPYIVSLKVPTDRVKQVIKNQELKAVISDSITFGQFLCQAQLICQTNDVIPKLITSLLKERSIKYLNGKDFVKQEIAPTISQSLVKLVNHQRSSKTLRQDLPRILSLLVLSLQSQGRLQRQQVQIIKGLLLVLRQQISECKNADRMLELSTVYKNCVRLFFKYKGNELNKPLLQSSYYKYRNYDIHNYDTIDRPKLQIQKLEKLKSQSLLNFTVNLDFDLQNNKLIKTETTPCIPLTFDISIRDIIGDVKSISTQVSKSTIEQQQKKQAIIDLRGCKHSLMYHLGEQKLKTICSRVESLLKLSQNKIYPDKPMTNQQQQLKNIVSFYNKQVFVPTVDDNVLQSAVVRLLKGQKQLDFLRNINNFEKVCGLLTLLLIKDYTGVQGWADNEVSKYLKQIKIDTDKEKYQQFVNRILSIFSQIGYSNFWVYSFKDLEKKQLKATEAILKSGTLPSNSQSLLSLILTFTLQSYVNKVFSDFSTFSGFIRSYFSSRSEQNQILTYKVTVSKTLLNLILKCIDFQHLNYVSILFYSNFENLRLYTDDLQEGFKALNLASKTRAYNEFLKLSNEYNDVQYLTPLKIFKQNLKFFVKIQKQGYLFKVQQEASITVERIINQLKSQTTTPEQIDGIMDQYFAEVDKLKANTINRVKSIYLSAKLRDLSLQNGTTISLLYQVLQRTSLSPAQIVDQISKVELFSIICSILYDLLSFESSYYNLNKYGNYSFIDLKSIKQDIIFSTTRRFGFNMNKHLNSLQFQFDQVVQSSLINAKTFLVSKIGGQWLESILVNPALPTWNRVKVQKARVALLKNIQQLLVSNHQKPVTISIRENQICEDLVKQLFNVPSQNFLKKDGLIIEVGSVKQSLDALAPKVINEAISKQILLKIDQTYIINKNKFSEDSLDVLQALGIIISYCIFWKIKLDLPLHQSIICQICSTIVDIDDLLTVDFKTWEYLRMVLSEADSKTLNLNFSYEFDSLTDPNKKEKIQLIDKGIQKKVNNLNRQQYVDFICCRILFVNVKLQLERLLTGVFKVLPKQYIANLSFSHVLQTFYKTQNKQLTKKLAFQGLKKFGIILPENYTSKELNFQNFKDFVNINWLLDVIFELPNDKFLKFCQLLGCKQVEFLNLKICTRTGPSQSIQLLGNETVLINHFKTKQSLRAGVVSKV